METYLAPWVVGLFSGLGILAIFVGIFRLVGSSGRALLMRVPPHTVARGAEQGEASAARRQFLPIAGRLDSAIGGLWFAEGIALGLDRADLALTVPEFMLIGVGSAAVLYTLAAVILHSLLGALVGAVIGLLLPQWYLRMRHGRRLRAFEDQLPDVVSLIVGGLRAGFGITQAIEAAARDMPDPSSKEFRRVVAEVHLGASLRTALDNMVRRIDSYELGLIATAITVQQEVGGNLAGVLRTIANTIRDRIRIQRQINILTAEKRITANILMALPFILGLLLYFLNPDYMRHLFDPGLMRILVAIVGGLQVVGYLIMRKMIDIRL